MEKASQSKDTGIAEAAGQKSYMARVPLAAAAPNSHLAQMAAAIHGSPLVQRQLRLKDEINAKARVTATPRAEEAFPAAAQPTQPGPVQRQPVRVGEDDSFLSEYKDDHTDIRFKKLENDKFLFKDRVIAWKDNVYKDAAGQVIDLQTFTNPEEDILDVTQGEIGYLANAQGTYKKIRSTSASPCVIAILHDNQKTMLAHIHRKNQVDGFVDEAVAKFGAENFNIEAALKTLTYNPDDNSPAAADERERQAWIIQRLREKLNDAFPNLTDLSLDEESDNAMIDAASHTITSPGDASVSGERGSLGVERARAIELGWQAAADNSQAFKIRTANVQPEDSALQFQKQDRALPFPRLSGRQAAVPAAAFSSGPTVQRKWEPVDSGKMRWDSLRNGLQWYFEKETGQMYFTVEDDRLAGEAAKDQNQRHTYNEWIKRGWLHEQDLELWKEAGWDLDSPIAVSIGGNALSLQRGCVYLVGVDHREQDAFVEAMMTMQSREVVFLNEGHDETFNVKTDKSGRPELPEHVFGLEGYAEKLATQCIFAATYYQRKLLGDEKGFEENKKRVVSDKQIAFDKIVDNNALQAEMERLSPGILPTLIQALQIGEHDQETVNVLLACAQVCTALAAQKSTDEDERESLTSEHEFSANFNPRLFKKVVPKIKNPIRDGPIQKLHELRERAMAENIRKALSPANAAVVCVGELHLESLIQKLSGVRIKVYKGDGAFYAGNKSG